MAAAIETPINEVSNRVPESASNRDSLLLDSTGQHKLLANESTGFNNIVILDPKNLAQRPRPGRRERQYASPYQHQAARRNQ